MRTIAFITLALTLSTFAYAAAQEVKTLEVTNRLLPKPVSIQEINSSFKLTNPVLIAIDKKASDRTRQTVDILSEEIKSSTGYKVKLTTDISAKNAIVLDVESGKNQEAYKMSVTPEGIRITGAGEQGLFYGTRTLLQLIDNGQVKCCTIEDNPTYKHRMVHYDMARDQTCNMEHLKHMIDMLSNHKVNMLHLYFENRFEFKKHPRVSPPGVMTQEQARELDEYALTKFVELVPEVNCLAHLEQALAVESYRHLSENPREPWEICTLNPEAVRFVEDMVAETAACFKSKYFHIGGDESAQLGECPKCAKRVEADGGKQKLFSDHWTHMAKYLKSIGKRPMLWGDMLLHYRGIAEAMPKDIIVFDWQYDNTSVETVKYFTSQGFEVYVCPAMSGFGRLAAPYKHATGNITKFIGEGVEGKAIGECTCSWELRIGHYFKNDTWGILLSADRSWNINAGDMADYEKRYSKEFFGLDDLRPVKYFQELSDGFASVIQPLPRSSWDAYSISGSNTYNGYGPSVTDEMLVKSDAKFSELNTMLDDLRNSVKRNKDFLDFADVPIYSTLMFVKGAAYYHRAEKLVNEAREQIKSEPDAAKAKLQNAIDLYEGMIEIPTYLEKRCRQAVDQLGGSEDDIGRVRRIREFSEDRIAEAKKLMSE